MSHHNDKSTGSAAKPNYVFSVISVALVLFLIGFFGLLILQGQSLIQFFKEKVNVIVEFQDGATDEDVKTLTSYLESAAFAKKKSVNFIGKEEGANMLKEEFGDEFIKLDLTNPIYDVITFNVKAQYLDRTELEKIRKTLMKYEFIRDVFYQESLVNQIAGNLKKLGLMAFVIGLIFIIVAVTLINNTIRLALFSNRFIIKNMELVGASWEFISRPYIWRSIRHGFLSAIIAILMLSGFLLLAWQNLPELENLYNLTNFGLLFAGICLAGVLITSLSTYFAVKKYLRMRTDDLY